MKLKKVISGGQTGADQTGVICAAELGLDTGGTMPKGFRTETGPNPTFAKTYGLTEHFDSSYVPRTRINAKEAEVTLWFGNTNSPGYYCTLKGCNDWGRPLIFNPTDLKDIAENYSVINVAGNRASTNPNVIDLVRNAFKTLRTDDVQVQ